MEAVHKLTETIEQARSSLSPSQLKKLRKKRGKLVQQVVHEQLNAEQPAAKRLCLDSDGGSGEEGEAAACGAAGEPEPSLSIQLSGHGPGSTAAAAAVAAAATAAGGGDGGVGDGSGGGCEQQHDEVISHHHHTQQQQHHHQHGRPPVPKQHQQHMKQHVLLQAVVPAPASSTSTGGGPCRTDLSGQLVVIQQELNSNNTGDNSNSTYSQLMLLQQQHLQEHPAAGTQALAVMQQPATGSDCSHGTHPAPGSSMQQHGQAGQQHQHGQHQRQQSQSQSQPHQQSRKASRASCQYGNYHHYYGYRLKPSGFEDPRLKVLDPSWFQGADVLDVGCNEGLVTLALAMHCGCRSVTGVDIDPVLVSKACTNLSRSRSQLNQQLHQAVRERNATAMRPRAPTLQLEQQQQEQQQQPGPTGPLDIIAASTMLPPAHRRSNANTSSGGSGPHSSQQVGDSKAGASAAAAAAAAAGGGTGGGGGGATTAAAAAAGEAGTAVDKQQQQPPQHKKQQPKQPPHAAPSPNQQQLPKKQLSPTARILAAQRQTKALTRVSFKAGNWLELPSPSNKYEVITCFSVTKWIQLNWGDDGIMKLFHKFYRCLAPGGLLVLEPQPFKSYKNAIHKPGVHQAPFVDLSQLKLRPEHFADFLTQRVGFELVQQLSAVSEVAGADAVSVKGFDRPIIVLRKPVAGGGGVVGGGGGKAGVVVG